MTLNIVILGLSITSSWGNGHATTYRALIKAMAARGHRITFLERDRPWYRGNRDLSAASYCRIELYTNLADVPARFGKTIIDADLVILGSFVPDGIALADWITTNARGVTAFYDIDTPVTLARLADGEVDYISGAMIPRFDIYLSFTGGPVLDLIEESYGSPRARALYCAVDPEFHTPVDVPSRWTLGYLGTYSEDRQAGLQRLLLEPARQRHTEQFVVAGPQYPDGIEWPSNVQRIEHLPPTEHPGFFCAQRYTLNVTRSDMAAAGYSPSVRLFEAAACGVPVISDPWPGVETILLPDREILLARNSADVSRILSDVPEERRRAIGKAARDRILQNHTAHHRAKQLEEYYAEVIAEPLLKGKVGAIAGATRRTGRTSER